MAARAEATSPQAVARAAGDLAVLFLAEAVRTGQEDEASLHEEAPPAGLLGALQRQCAPAAVTGQAAAGGLDDGHAGLPLRCVALTAPGDHDTHDDQAGDLARNLKLTSDSLRAFQRDLEARGLANRALVHVWSEFGRRAEENGSRGTDHGAGGIGFVVGSRARGQMVGEFPGLGSGGLDGDGNLRSTSDFRALYCSLLEQWMGTDASGLIPSAGSFSRPRLVA